MIFIEDINFTDKWFTKESSKIKKNKKEKYRLIYEYIKIKLKTIYIS